MLQRGVMHGWRHADATGSTMRVAGQNVEVLLSVCYAFPSEEPCQKWLLVPQLVYADSVDNY
jgi:hypothetical protein